VKGEEAVRKETKSAMVVKPVAGNRASSSYNEYINCLYSRTKSTEANLSKRNKIRKID
jgi:hypothetical protein